VKLTYPLPDSYITHIIVGYFRSLEKNSVVLVLKTYELGPS
jgi:hypothetical protein